MDQLLIVNNQYEFMNYTPHSPKQTTSTLDVIPNVKFSGFSWTKANDGLFYSVIINKYIIP